MSVLLTSNGQRGKKVIADSHIELVRHLIAAQKVDKPVAFGQLNAQAKAILIRSTVYRVFFDWGKEIDYPVYDGKLPNYVAHFDKAYLDLQTEENSNVQRRKAVSPRHMTLTKSSNDLKNKGNIRDVSHVAAGDGRRDGANNSRQSTGRSNKNRKKRRKSRCGDQDDSCNTSELPADLGTASFTANALWDRF